ncbi:hypothetical protein GCM10010211_37420 [Streptomyces albospinus]|uniref:DUF317 domain-containing protein n=1 Tax=Streptomyces albospinus TaxID=285515 RepID=A0ABQ2V6K3_9ACTN|nr:DUF317 domain-containing protein [Streptomyces albospinus]GGU68575.1 hypothetical protein GCM10010211_37420 [Streptomyces albospinus]
MTLTATAPFQAPATLPFAALGEREWLLDCHCAGPVTDLLKNQGWDVISDLDSNVHCSSPDQRVPESPAAARGELWHIHVKGTNGTTAWHQSFGPDTPAQAVAGFLAALISAPSRSCACI